MKLDSIAEDPVAEQESQWRDKESHPKEGGMGGPAPSQGVTPMQVDTPGPVVTGEPIRKRQKLRRHTVRVGAVLPSSQEGF